MGTGEAPNGGKGVVRGEMRMSPKLFSIWFVEVYIMSCVHSQDASVLRILLIHFMWLDLRKIERSGEIGGLWGGLGCCCCFCGGGLWSLGLVLVCCCLLACICPPGGFFQLDFLP